MQVGHHVRPVGLRGTAKPSVAAAVGAAVAAAAAVAAGLRQQRIWKI
jgi:hypothetical protein